MTPDYRTPLRPPVRLAVGLVVRPCAKSGCRELVATGGRCVTHRARAEEARGSSSERGYDYLWQQFRRDFLADHPLCVDCQAIGQVEASREVHHIQKLADYPELRLVEDNCMALCSTCHAVRTRRGE